MAYACPKCGAPVQRGSSAVAQQAFGLVGALVHAAFAGFACAKCGKLEKSTFPPDVQAQMTRNSVLLGGGGVLLFIAVIGVVIAINS